MNLQTTLMKKTTAELKEALPKVTASNDDVCEKAIKKELERRGQSSRDRATDV